MLCFSFSHSLLFVIHDQASILDITFFDPVQKQVGKKKRLSVQENSEQCVRMSPEIFNLYQCARVLTMFKSH